MKDFGEGSMKQILLLIIFISALCLSAFAQVEKLPCPNIEITSPTSAVRTGETISFSASVGSEVKNYDVKYKWSVNKGTIIEGQGTSSIKIDTTGLDDTLVTATFEIIGLPAYCNNSISESGVVVTIKDYFPIDEYEKITLKEESHRLDNLMITLINASEMHGYIVMNLKENETIKNAKNRIQNLVRHLKFRKFPLDRITFIIQKADNHRTVIHALPKNSNFLECKNCHVIKASDFK